LNKTLPPQLSLKALTENIDAPSNLRAFHLAMQQELCEFVSDSIQSSLERVVARLAESGHRFELVGPELNDGILDFTLRSADRGFTLTIQAIATSSHEYNLKSKGKLEYE